MFNFSGFYLKQTFNHTWKEWKHTFSTTTKTTTQTTPSKRKWQSNEDTHILFLSLSLSHSLLFIEKWLHLSKWVTGRMNDRTTLADLRLILVEETLSHSVVWRGWWTTWGGVRSWLPGCWKSLTSRMKVNSKWMINPKLMDKDISTSMNFKFFTRNKEFWHRKLFLMTRRNIIQSDCIHVCRWECVNFQASPHNIIQIQSIVKTTGVRPMGLGGRGLQPPRIFQIAIFGQNKSGNIRVNLLDFRASNEKTYSSKRLQPPNETRPVRLCSKQTGIHYWKQRILQHFIFYFAAYSSRLRIP